MKTLQYIIFAFISLVGVNAYAAFPEVTIINTTSDMLKKVCLSVKYRFAGKSKKKGSVVAENINPDEPLTVNVLEGTRKGRPVLTDEEKELVDAIVVKVRVVSKRIYDPELEERTQESKKHAGHVRDKKKYKKGIQPDKITISDNEQDPKRLIIISQ